MASGDLAEIRVELMTLLGDRGNLQAEEVLQFAKANPSSAIAAAFRKRGLFDDAKAAEIARLDFAREIIRRVRVRFIRPEHPPVPLRVFINLLDERKTDHRGYRLRSDVRSDSERLAMLKQQFAVEISTLVKRYVDILSPEHIDMLQLLASEVSETEALA